MEENEDMKPIREVLREAMEWIISRRGLAPEKGNTYMETLQSFRNYYRSVENEILSLAKEDPFKWFQSYPMDLRSIFTPIEENVWSIIRSMGRIVLYPQYPIGIYFADFANPYFKIAVEVDGKQFHQDPSKDRYRDFQLKHLGWNVFRISGAETFSSLERGDNPDDNELDLEKFNAWLYNSAEGVIWAIKMIFFEKIDMNEYEHAGSVIGTLEKHSYNYRY